MISIITCIDNTPLGGDLSGNKQGEKWVVKKILGFKKYFLDF